MFKYKFGVLGGTFDHLHPGHKYLLDTAFSLSEKVTIGLATEKVYQNKFLSHLIEPFSVRRESLENYLKEKKYFHRTEITILNDIYGPTLKIKNINAIFVTETTLPNAMVINEGRNKNGLTPLEIVTIPFKFDESNKVITSERIRLGEIDREGQVFMSLFKEKDVLKLPSELRHELRRPIGKVIKDADKLKDIKSQDSFLITVGDIVTKSFKDIGIEPDIQIIDFKSRRSIIDKEALKDFKLASRKLKMKMLRNDPGTIQKEIVIAYKIEIDLIAEKRQSQTIVIDGEEDLLTLPAILFAPLGSYVCYGQFDLNAMIMVEVTEENKKKVFDLLRQFE